MINWQNIDWKKVGIMGGFVLVVIIAGYLIYALFFKGFMPSETPSEPEVPSEDFSQLPDPTKGEQPGTVAPSEPTVLLPGTFTPDIPTKSATIASPIASGGITKVNDLDYSKTTALSLAKDGASLITYNPDEGKFYMLADDGTKTQLGTKIYKNVSDVAFSSTQDQAILEFPDGSNIFYDFNTDKQITLPKNWTEFNFNEQGNQIAFIDNNELPDYRFLGIASPDGASIKYLEKVGDRAHDFFVDWSPNNKIVSIFRNDGTADTTKIFFVGQHGENIKSVVINGYGLVPKWTPDGSKLLYSAYNKNSDFKPLLHIVDADGTTNNGNNHQSLGINTWADKCAFAGTTTAYCAVPQELPTGAGLARELADNTPDYIYKIDLKTGAKTFVAKPELDHTVDQITVSADGSNLFFTDKNTETVHSINLK